jgi:topoisomerase IA-like protein
MIINLSDAMIRVIRLALIHAIKDGKKYEQRDGDYTVDLDDAFELFTELKTSGTAGEAVPEEQP